MGCAHLLSKGSRLGQYVFILPCESSLCCLIWTDSNTHTHTHLFGIAFMSLALSRSLAVHLSLSLSVSWAELHWGGQLLYSQFVSSACLTVLPLITTSQLFGAVSHRPHTTYLKVSISYTLLKPENSPRSRSWNSPDTCLLYNNKNEHNDTYTLNGAQIYNKCLFFCFSRFTAQMQNNCIKRERERKKKQASSWIPKISIFIWFMLASFTWRWLQRCSPDSEDGSWGTGLIT